MKKPKTNLIATTLLLIVLAYIAWSDFKSRLIHINVFIALFVIIAIKALSNHNLLYTLSMSLLNLAIVILVLLTCAITTSKKIKIKDMFTYYFGLGDLLTLILLSFVFSVYGLILTIVISSIAGLCSYIIYYINQNDKHIPFAGFLSITSVVLIIGSLINITPQYVLFI